MMCHNIQIHWVGTYSMTGHEGARGWSSVTEGREAEYVFVEKWRRRTARCHQKRPLCVCGLVEFGRCLWTRHLIRSDERQTPSPRSPVCSRPTWIHLHFLPNGTFIILLPLFSCFRCSHVCGEPQLTWVQFLDGAVDHNLQKAKDLIQRDS